MVDMQTISIEVDSTLKVQAESIFTKLGLSATDAVTLFYEQVCAKQNLPFEAEKSEIGKNKCMAALDELKALQDKLRSSQASKEAN